MFNRFQRLAYIIMLISGAAIFYFGGSFLSSIGGNGSVEAVSAAILSWPFVGAYLITATGYTIGGYGVYKLLVSPADEQIPNYATGVVFSLLTLSFAIPIMGGLIYFAVTESSAAPIALMIPAGMILLIGAGAGFQTMKVKKRG